MRWFPCLLLGSFLLTGCAKRPALPPAGAVPPADSVFSFALLGDQQYDPEREQEFSRLMGMLDRDTLAFVLHVGDIKGGSTPCSDSLFEARHTQFSRATHPFILLFGDNEWTDCHRAGGDPLDRLARLRALFTAGDQSLGRSRLALERQSEDPRFAAYRENVRWVEGGVLFVGLHVVGSSNNRGRTPAMDAEYEARNAADLSWLRDAFRLAAAQNLRGILLALHANPGLFPGEITEASDGFEALTAVLRALVPAFGKPVVLVHGDTHRCRIDHPWRNDVPGFTRVEVFGNPFSHWVRGRVDPADPALFRFEPQSVPGNPPAGCLLGDA